MRVYLIIYLTSVDLQGLLHIAYENDSFDLFKVLLNAGAPIDTAATPLLLSLIQEDADNDYIDALLVCVINLLCMGGIKNY